MFTVRFIAEDALPPDQVWALSIDQDGNRYLFIKEGAKSCTVLEEAWQGEAILLPHVADWQRAG